MTFDAANAFYEEFLQAIAQEVQSSGFPVDDWFKIKRARGATVADDIKDWTDRGPGLVENYIRWYESSGAEVWVTPDGIPAVELPIEVMFGDTPVRGYIDQVLWYQGCLVVVDVKTGSAMPDSRRQLGMYASMIERKYGIRPLKGSYFMCRGVGKRGEAPRFYLSPPEPLNGYEYSIEHFTHEFDLLNQATEAGIFMANPGAQCTRCSVAYACPVVGGTEARKYDPSLRKETA